jgi:hypothetical protein
MAAPVVASTNTSSSAVPLARKGRGATAAFSCAIVFLIGGLVRAETLIDPTRSPLGNRGVVEAAAGEVEAAPVVPTRVQMIFRGPGETRTAVIEGNNVRVGDTVRLRTGTARVERITDTTVVLARADGHETLQLLPGIERSVRCARPDSQRPGC